MKIVVLDGYTLNPGDISWSGLERLGELTVYDRTAYHAGNEDLIMERIDRAKIVFTNKTPLSRTVLENAPDLKFIGVLATGYNIVDVEAAKERGIVVTNIPAYGTNFVAQMAIALLLEMCCHVWPHSESVRRGEWSGNPDWCYWNYPLIELAGKTMGIIGYGRIGQATGRIAQALGMRILAVDSNPDPSLESPDMKYADMDTLLAKSDAIMLHCPLFENTKGIINKQSIAKMKPGVMIVNNARGPLIVEEDLAEALNSGKVAGAALDVVSTEPIQMDNLLLQAKNCIITPHISWASLEARIRLMDLAVRNLEQFLAGFPENVVS
ncbi:MULTISPECIES: D-2-hydroxyacid dehydrogenase [unclassified Dehalobacter]|jgi:Lactate dehydrogenase and related dehydrogenases|uniref:D-2-hydroxyacid dehydrogenase n=1 Tax=unclassified Dehalobacter TaxID=2635733 RepID=UPI00028A4567|nr:MULTISPECIES: D-2-hydroxyacid dehydrogenase [unclassified Dehalobacter]AFV01986.1 D-3-phosphoglycerate dehydrogenase [Dehalobacter sp. DCA]AFV05022.1 D-3-phosphoglycerate dehydrogenase [Dehalobacter sp. CF]